MKTWCVAVVFTLAVIAAALVPSPSSASDPTSEVALDCPEYVIFALRGSGEGPDEQKSIGWEGAVLNRAVEALEGDPELRLQTKVVPVSKDMGYQAIDVWSSAWGLGKVNPLNPAEGPVSKVMREVYNSAQTGNSSLQRAYFAEEKARSELRHCDRPAYGVFGYSQGSMAARLGYSSTPGAFSIALLVADPYQTPSEHHRGTGRGGIGLYILGPPAIDIAFTRPSPDIYVDTTNFVVCNDSDQFCDAPAWILNAEHGWYFDTEPKRAELVEWFKEWPATVADSVRPPMFLDVPQKCSDATSTDWSEVIGLPMSVEFSSGNPIPRGPDAESYVHDSGGATHGTEWLTCVWSVDRGLGDTGHLRTDIISVTPEERRGLLREAEVQGMDCTFDEGAFRCDQHGTSEEGPMGGGMPYGSTWYFKDNLAVITDYWVVAPVGYTNDIISTVWEKR